MRKRIICLLLLLMMLPCIPAAQAASAPEVITHPEPQIVIEGGKCTFTAPAKGDTGITWRLRSPDGDEDFYKDVFQFAPQNPAFHDTVNGIPEEDGYNQSRSHRNHRKYNRPAQGQGISAYVA